MADWWLRDDHGLYSSHIGRLRSAGPCARIEISRDTLNRPCFRDGIVTDVFLGVFSPVHNHNARVFELRQVGDGYV